MKKFVLALILTALAVAPVAAEEPKSKCPFFSPACHIIFGEKQIAHGATPNGGSFVRVGSTIEWPSGLTAELSVNQHCVVDVGGTDDCSLGNLSGLNDLSTATLATGYSYDLTETRKVRVLADVTYAEADWLAGVEVRVQQDSLALFARYGTGLTDDLAPLTEQTIGDVTVGVAMIFGGSK